MGFGVVLSVPERARKVLGAQLPTAFAVALTIMVLHAAVMFLVLDDGTRLPKYPRIAAQFLGSGVPSERLVDFSPLYLWIHVAAQRLTGNPGLAIQWLQTALVSATGGMLFLLLRSLVSAQLALAGTAVFALNRSVLIFEHQFEPEPLLLFAFVAFALASSRDGLKFRAVGGALLALAILTRPTALALALLAPLTSLFRGTSRRRWLAGTAIFLAPVVAAVMFLGIRNMQLAGRFTPAVMNPGTVFYEGNNPISLGQSAAYPPLVHDMAGDSAQVDYEHEIYRMFARRITGKALSVAEVNSFWAGKALSYMADHPGYALRGAAGKLFAVFHSNRSQEINSDHVNDLTLGKNMIPSFPFSVVAALALLGMAGVRPRRREVLVPFLIVLVMTGSMIATYASDRQRVSLVPFFVLFACLGARRLAEEPRGRVPLLVATALLAALLWRETDVMQDRYHLTESLVQAQGTFNKALALRKQSDLTGAARLSAATLAWGPWMGDQCRLPQLPFGPKGFAVMALEEASAREPRTFSERFDRGLLLLEANHLDEARAVFAGLDAEKRRFNRLFLGSSEPRVYLARIAARQGRVAEAVALLKAVLASHPGEPWALAQLAALTGEAAYEEELRRYFDEIDAAFFVGQASLEHRRFDLAADRLSRMVPIVPEYQRGLVYLAAALGGAGRLREGVAAYRSAVARGIRSLFLEKEIVDLFRRAAEMLPGDADARNEYGRVLSQFGRHLEGWQVMATPPPALPPTR